MSNTKIWTTVIIIVALIAVVWVWRANSAPSAAVPATSQNNAAQNQQAASQPAVSTGASASTDTSNTGLEQDVNAVDNQINGINTDTSNATQGMSSSPTPTAQ